MEIQLSPDSFDDWSLRDPSSSQHPMPGGIEKRIDAALAWGSLLVFFIASFLHLKGKIKVWVAVILSFALSFVMLVSLTFMRLYYVLNNGIDTL